MQLLEVRASRRVSPPGLRAACRRCRASALAHTPLPPPKPLFLPPAPFLPPRSFSPPHHQVAPTADYHAFDTARAVAEAKEGAPRYAVVPSTAPMFFPGFGASIELSFPDGSKETVGHFGILHPEVLQNFSISMPVTVLEMGLGECQFVVCFVSSFFVISFRFPELIVVVSHVSSFVYIGNFIERKRAAPSDSKQH